MPRNPGLRATGRAKVSRGAGCARPTLRQVEKETAVIVERWGKYKELLREGIHFFVPIMDRVRPITWRWVDDHDGNDRKA